MLKIDQFVREAASHAVACLRGSWPVRLLGPSMGIITLLYLLNVYQGMLKWDPVSAPIGASTVGAVSAFAGIGAGISLISALWSRTWIPASGLVLNAAALSIWRYWIASEMLLPYEPWLHKVGMP